MSGSLRIPSDFANSERRDLEDELDKELNRYSFTHNNDKLFEDSPNKSELNQFGDFSGSHSQFDGSGSIERGMANLEKSTDFSFRSKSAMPPMSTLSSLSSRTESPRKTRSEGGRRSSSINRFSPMSARKVTAIGMHESESDYSPSKYYQPARTPHGATRMNVQSTRKISPRSFKNTATLFEDLGLDDSLQPANATTLPAGQSFRLPKNIPDLSTMLSSSRKPGHRVIDSIPVSEDNQKLFAALQDLQATVDNLERQQRDSQDQMRKLKEALRKAESQVKTEQQRAGLAESELKQHLTKPAKEADAASDEKFKALEARNSSLLNALTAAKKEVADRSLELEVAREEAVVMDEECNRATQRLANALENVTQLTNENEKLKARVSFLENQLKSPAEGRTNSAQTGDAIDDRITDRLRRHETPVSQSSDSKKTRKKVVDDASCSDEGIEVTRSILHDSEIEDLNREVEDARRKKTSGSARIVQRKSESAKVNQRKSSAQSHKSVGRPAVEIKVQKRPDGRPIMVRKISVEKRRRESKRKAFADVSGDDTFASAEEDDTEIESELEDTSEEETDREMTGLFSTAEDEPSQILYRRKPVHQTKGRSSATTKVNVEKVVRELSRHDSAQCSICSRKKAAKATATQAKTQPTAFHQQTQTDDANATIRPSQAPLPALHSVLAGLEDEFRHLKIKYHNQTEEYNKLDPSLGKRQRKTLAQDLRTTIEALEGKADQIYSIFDVLEAAATGMPLNNAETVLPQAKQAPAQPHTSSRPAWIYT